MIPFAIPLALKTLPWKWIGIGAGVLAALLALWWLYSAIYDAGASSVQKKWDDAVRAAKAKAQADSWALVGDINQIDTSVQAGKTATTRLEVKYRDRIVRTAVDVYRDRPGCRAPDGLWRANDQLAGEYATVAKLGVLVLRSPDATGQR